MSIRLEINDDEFNRRVGRLVCDVEAAKVEVLRSGAKQLQSMGTRAFRDESLRPVEWAPLKPATVKAKARKKRPLPLIDTGTLMRSLRVGEVTADGGAEVVSDREYAGYQQFGTSRMPARPFLSIIADGPDAAEAQLAANAKPLVEAALERALRRVLREAAGNG